MTTTVAQMIKWLKTLPPDAEVRCGYERSNGYSFSMAIGDVDIDSCIIVNYTSEGYRERYPSKAPAKAGKTFVEIHSGD